MSLRTASTIWVSTGIISGGLLSGIKKLVSVAKEPSTKYRDEFIETPIQFVYCLSRVAMHMGGGAIIGGVVALTAPVSIPLYMLVKS
jgi:hypothetical protein